MHLKQASSDIQETAEEKKRLTEQLCAQKEAAKLMAKDLETVSQRLLSLQKSKAAEAKRALIKQPKKISKSCQTEIAKQSSCCQTEITEQCQSSCQTEITEQRQSSCQRVKYVGDDEFYDDEPERVSAHKHGHAHKVWPVWPDTEDEE